MLFLTVFKVGDNLDFRLRRFHIVAPLHEKHFMLKIVLMYAEHVLYRQTLF